MATREEVAPLSVAESGWYPFSVEDLEFSGGFRLWERYSGECFILEETQNDLKADLVQRRQMPLLYSRETEYDLAYIH